MEEIEKLSVISRHFLVSERADGQDEFGRVPDLPLGNGPRGKEELGYTPVFLARVRKRLERREMHFALGH